MPTLVQKLLVVDDEPATRSLMTEIFARIGFSVRVAEDGFAALAEIRQDLPTVILSDLNMPGMSGFELLSVVRRRYPQIQVVAMSGAFSGDNVQVGVAADAFYEKATSLPNLLRVVDQVANHPAVTIRAPSPFWIQRDSNDASMSPYITISCPECLRTFPQVSGAAIGSVHIHELECVYCSTVIHFAIVQSSNGASPQSFQSKPENAFPMPLMLPSL